MKIYACLCFLLLSSPSLLAGEKLVKKTFVYKTVGDTPIHADVYRPDDTKVRPVVVWLHGGALIVGSRTSVSAELLDLCGKEGYVLVSFDYRLAPEVKLPEIIEDVKDAFRWLRTEGPKQFAADPDKLAVTGRSAGGYLTMMTGICVTPRPKALVAYWGYGDVDGDWCTKPSEVYRKEPLADKAAAYQAVGKKVLTGAEGDSGKARSVFFLYLWQNGLWTKEVTGFDPSERAKLDPYCPVRNITAEYPPTLMIHGTKDEDVPYQESAEMAKALAKRGVPHELVAVPGAGHGLDGGDKKLVEAAHEKAAAFIRKHLK